MTFHQVVAFDASLEAKSDISCVNYGNYEDSSAYALRFTLIVVFALQPSSSNVLLCKFLLGLIFTRLSKFAENKSLEKKHEI